MQDPKGDSQGQEGLTTSQIAELEAAMREDEQKDYNNQEQRNSYGRKDGGYDRYQKGGYNDRGPRDRKNRDGYKGKGGYNDRNRESRDNWGGENRG